MKTTATSLWATALLVGVAVAAAGCSDPIAPSVSYVSASSTSYQPNVDPCTGTVYIDGVYGSVTSIELRDVNTNFGYELLVPNAKSGTCTACWTGPSGTSIFGLKAIVNVGTPQGDYHVLVNELGGNWTLVGTIAAGSPMSTQTIHVTASVDKHANCGICGNACSSSQTCQFVGIGDRNGEGFYTCSGCPSGEMECNNECKDLQNDPNNCGGCGIMCKDLQECVAGHCLYTQCSPDPTCKTVGTKDTCCRDPNFGFTCRSCNPDPSRYDCPGVPDHC